MADPQETADSGRRKMVEDALEESAVVNEEASAALRVVANTFDRMAEKMRRLQQTHPSIAESLIKSRDSVISAGNHR